MDTLFEATISKTKPPRNRKDFIFSARPERTVEWLGGVTYSNLENILGGIKELMRKNSKEEIHLLVSSYGGATGIGMSFYDSVKTWLKPKLCTIGSGDVDSSGIIVFLAGEKRMLTQNTTMLLHLGGRTFDRDKRFSTVDMENMLKEDRLKDMQYANVISDATGGKYSPDKILRLMARNTILTAEEAVNMGLAHKILRAEA
ncbi:MAG: ATP-dependent Clp protease proteolytic subunit [bacterium]|nr:ATP-dependent Clp protease proteolytic subunit [bacterium]